MDLTFVLTHDCNLGCSYCYAGRKFRKSMSREVRDQALDLAFSDVKSGQTLRLCYFGGEPTLEWDLLVETASLACSRAKRANIELEQSMTTNGTLLTKERVHTLAELGVFVGFSIDGTRAAHDAERPHMGGKSSFDDVRTGLQHVLAQGLPFETISVVTPASAPLLGQSVAFLFELGVPRVTVNMAYEAAWTDASLEHIKQGLVASAQVVADHFRAGRIVSFALFDNKIALRGNRRKATCAVGEGAVAVAPSGNVYPCERMVAEDEVTTYVIGHVSTGLAAPKMRTHRDALPLREYAQAPTSPKEAEHHSTNDECGDCSERGRCSAYCACANLAETGNIGVAGGVQCMFERVLMEVSDALFEVMASEQNAAFAEWFRLDWSHERAALHAKQPAHALERTEHAPRPHALPVVR
jgi:uncharacterized protein